MLGILLFGGITGAAQLSSKADATEMLLEVRRKVMLAVSQLPRYLCTETVDRTISRPKGSIQALPCRELAVRRSKKAWGVRKVSSDRLRLDVAVSGEQEMYSWVGEDRFQDRSLSDLVGSGATSTGAFASFLISVFGTNAAAFTYNGEVTVSGHSLTEFGFRVPLGKSLYQVGDKLHHAVVGYDGTFLVNPDTRDLVRLTVHANELPEVLDVCDVTTTLDYDSQRRNDSEFLLPKSARFDVLDSDGSELDSGTIFSGCHQFYGESTLRFDQQSGEGDVASRQPAAAFTSLPPDVPFTVMLTEPIDTTTAAAGDVIKGRLTSPIKEKRAGLLIPKGAQVTGRIMELQRLFDAGNEGLTLAVKLETVQIGEVQLRIDARLKPAVGIRRPNMHGQDLGSFDGMQTRAVAIFRFNNVNRNFVIRRGLELEGRTAR